MKKALLPTALLLSVFLFAEPAKATDASIHLERDDSGRFIPVLIDRGKSRTIIDVDAITAPALSPNGSRLAFSGAVGDESLGEYAIFVSRLDGTELEQVTPGQWGEFDPAWSPDGRYILFAENRTGSITFAACCRISRVDVETGTVSAITSFSGAQRPAYSPSGDRIIFDNPIGVFTMSSSGGAAILRAPGGFDAQFSPNGDSVVYIRASNGSHQLVVHELGTGDETVIYSTPGSIESPYWRGARISFLEYSGAGYDGRTNVRMRSIDKSGSAPQTARAFSKPVVGGILIENDEMFFYRDDGLYRYYNIRPDGTLPSPMLQGDGYTSGWSSITAVDLDGDGQDEMFFYRDDGLYRFYNIRPNGQIGSPILAGDDFTANWTTITGIDLEGDGQDEMFFYRDDGLFRFYDVQPNGKLGNPIRQGNDFTQGWSSITAIDLNGDGGDEMFFYREDGLYRYYEVSSTGTLGGPLLGGDDYTAGWSSMASIQLDP